jgi:hypothetical protein
MSDRVRTAGCQSTDLRPATGRRDPRGERGFRLSLPVDRPPHPGQRAGAVSRQAEEQPRAWPRLILVAVDGLVIAPSLPLSAEGWTRATSPSSSGRCGPPDRPRWLSVTSFVHELKRLWLKLQRRSQKTRMTGDRFKRLTAQVDTPHPQHASLPRTAVYRHLPKVGAVR